MEKKISIKTIYLLLVISLGLVGLGIGSTYAVFTASSEIISPISLGSNLSYDSGVLETVSLKVLPGEVISTTLNITNSSDANLNYVTWYIDEGYDIDVVGETGEMQGVISPSSSSTIVVSVRNSSDYAVTVNIGVSSSEDSIVLGNNMKVLDSANFLMGTKINPSDDTALFLRSNLQRGEIETITFVDNINIPEGNTSVDVSKHNDSSVMMWYGDKNSNNLYDVYIGAKNGTIFLSSGWCLFKYLTNVKIIDFTNCVNTRNVTDMTAMFNNCTSLTELDVSGFDTSMVTAMNSMFYECYGLAELDLSNFDTSSVTGMGTMFYDCKNLTELDISKFDTSNVTNMHHMFCNCTLLTELDVSEWDTSKVTNMQSMFLYCRSLKKLDVSSWDTSHVTDMSSMFLDCGSLTNLNVSNWNTSKVNNMYRIFYGCKNIEELNVSNWNTSNVKDMSYMFHLCKKIKTLNVSKWDTSNVTNMSNMFQSCNSLTEINVSNWNTSKVTDMSGMFGYSGFITLDLSNWDTSSLTKINEMFRTSTKLTTIDLSGFDTSKVTDMHIMFEGCPALTKIYVSDKWSTLSVTDSANMFNNCSKLVGGNGTTYDASFVDKTYARVDGGTSSPGYFTYKAASV